MLHISPIGLVLLQNDDYCTEVHRHVINVHMHAGKHTEFVQAMYTFILLPFDKVPSFSHELWLLADHLMHLWNRRFFSQPQLQWTQITESHGDTLICIWVFRQTEWYKRAELNWESISLRIWVTPCWGLWPSFCFRPHLVSNFTWLEKDKKTGNHSYKIQMTQ